MNNDHKKRHSEVDYKNCDLSILSWNVHDINHQTLGKKTDQNEFTRILTSGLIFCLQETKGNVELPQYKCFNKLRSDSRSGGLCIGVHRSISEFVRPIMCESQDILAART